MKILLAALLLALPSAAQPLPVQSFQLKNGLRVLLIEDHQHPVIHLQLAAGWGRSQEPKINACLGPLSLGVLDHCTVGHRSREAFNRAVEERGLALTLSGIPDGLVWNLVAGSPEAESAFALLADAVSRPFIVGGDLDDQRVRLIQEIQEKTPRDRARTTFLRQLERPDLTLEAVTEMALRHIFIEELQGFIQETLRPRRAVLAISGDLTLTQARQLTQLNFGTWAEGGDSTIQPTPEALATPPIVAASDVKETSLALPFRAADAPQRAALDLLRIWLPRRLGVDRCIVHPGAAGWCSLILTTPSPTSVEKEELRALRNSGLSAKDLEQAKALWHAQDRALGLRPLERLTATTMSALLGEASSEKDIQAVNLIGLNATLRAWLNFNVARELVLGGEPIHPPQNPTPNREAKSK